MSGDDDLSRFAQEYGVGLVRFAYLLCGDVGTAEDLVQVAYLALFRKFGGHLPLDAPVAYARKTIANAHLSRFRRGHRTTELLLADLPDAEPVQPVDGSEQDAMRHAMSRLPERQRTVLVCRYYLDLSDEQIAELIGARAGTVRSLAARAFATLRQNPDLTFRSVTR